MQDYITPEDYISPSEQAQMDADAQLPEFGYWVGLICHFGNRLRRIAAPLFVKLNTKFLITATRMGKRKKGDLHFRRQGDGLFMAFSIDGKSSEYRPVPKWTLLALQPMPHTIEQLQSSEPLYVMEPGRERQRKATPYETQLATMVCLRRAGKTWAEIGEIVGIGRYETQRLAKEIEIVFRDIQQMAEHEQVDLDRCHQLNHEWIGHNKPDAQPRWSNRNPGSEESTDENDLETLIVR